MTDSSSIDLCVQVVRTLSETETWLLSAKGIKHFAESVFTFAAQIPGSMESVDSLHKIAQERYWNFYTRCKRVAETINQAEGWQLTAGEIEKLVTAVLPYVLASPACIDNDSAIATIIINYDAEGPMVQAMLAIGSSAGEKLWVEWRAHMLKVAHSKGLATDDAEELVQGVYLNAQKGLRQFCHQSKLQTYFFKIFTNHYCEWLRNKRRQRDGESPPPGSSNDLPELPDKAVNLENDIIHHIHLVEIADYVKQEIIKLTSTEDFALLYLYYVEKDYVDPQSKKVVKWTDEAIAYQWQMTYAKVAARRERAERKIIKCVFERLGADRVEQLVGATGTEILRLYYVEHDYKDPQTKQHKIWTDKAISIRLGITPQAVKDQRNKAVTIIGLAYAHNLLNDDSP